VINGRPRKIEGNPAHPLNRGKLCARGQAGLQTLYDPDRLQNAVAQTGGRTSRHFEPLHWDDALSQVVAAIEQIDARKRIAFLTGLIPDHLYTLVNMFQKALGASQPIQFDLHGTLEGRVEAQNQAGAWFDEPRLPIYDIAAADVIFSFGANLFETWMSPVSQSVDYGEMRRGTLGGRGYLAQFEPRLSTTGASADEWIPIQPGTEGLIAIGLGRIIVEDNLGRVGSHAPHAHFYRDVNLEEISEVTAISIAELRRLAHIFADADRALAIPGGQISGQTNSRESMDAVMALNLIMRRFGREGGVFLPQPVPASRFNDPPSPASFSDLQRFIGQMQSGEIDLLFMYDCNPVYELPEWMRFVEGLRNVPMIISFSSVVDETALWSDLILPDHTYLESWGYQIPEPGADRPVVSSSQPVVTPLYDTRSTADVLLAVASSLGGTVAQELHWPDEVAFIEAASADLLGSSVGVYDARTPARFWNRWRQFGGWWSDKPFRKEPEARGPQQSPLNVPRASFAGDADRYPFHLLPYPSISLSDGRGANQALLQELPDPLTTIRWNTWVEINPETAAELGVENDHVVRVISEEGELEAPVMVHPGIRPDVIAIPLGQGHTDSGRFAARRGHNAMDLILPVSVTGDERLLWGATRVRIEPTGKHQKLARLESLEGEGRENIR
jgi:anaerobic selenocysteine-containing dehydrogenase